MKRFIGSVTVLSVAFLLAALTQSVIAQPRAYTAQLSGANEVPPVVTNARGNAVLRLSADGSEVSYRLFVANIQDVRFAHIHHAPAGLNGGVVITLYPGPTILGPVNGTLAEGTFTAADLDGSLAGMQLSDFIEKLENGELYINVHTDANPGGEIRGQL